MIFSLDVEDQVREMSHRPAPDAGEFEFERIAGGTTFGMTGDMPECLFDGIDKAQRDPVAGLLKVMLHSLQKILVRPGAPDDGLDTHLPA